MCKTKQLQSRTKKRDIKGGQQQSEVNSCVVHYFFTSMAIYHSLIMLLRRSCCKQELKGNMTQGLKLHSSPSQLLQNCSAVVWYSLLCNCSTSDKFKVGLGNMYIKNLERFLPPFRVTTTMEFEIFSEKDFLKNALPETPFYFASKLFCDNFWKAKKLHSSCRKVGKC